MSTENASFNMVLDEAVTVNTCKSRFLKQRSLVGSQNRGYQAGVKLKSLRNPSTKAVQICNGYNSTTGCSWPNCHFLHKCNIDGCTITHAHPQHEHEKLISKGKNRLCVDNIAENLHSHPLTVEQWETELEVDVDRNFLLDGLTYGFKIIDDVELFPVRMRQMREK